MTLAVRWNKTWGMKRSPLMKRNMEVECVVLDDETFDDIDEICDLLGSDTTRAKSVMVFLLSITL